MGRDMTRDPIVEAVREDLHQRSQHGIAKYGTTLAGNPIGLQAWLQHAYEEALDFACYLKRAMAETPERPAVGVSWCLPVEYAVEYGDQDLGWHRSPAAPMTYPTTLHARVAAAGYCTCGHEGDE